MIRKKAIFSIMQAFSLMFVLGDVVAGGNFNEGEIPPDRTAARILDSWHGDYPVEKLSLLPDGQQKVPAGYIDDARAFEIVWKAIYPGEPPPRVDLRKNIILFARNTRFYNRIRIGKVTVTDGVGEILAMETMSALPIEDVAAISMVLVERRGIEAIRTPEGLLQLPETRNPETYVYKCGDDFSFTARIEGEDAWLFLPGRTVRLPRVPSTSGAKYRQGRTLFWTKEAEARLETNGERYAGCANDPAEAVWEDAKFRGVDFRAVGNEPGWNLEIAAAGTIRFVGDYGNTHYNFPTPEPTSHPQEMFTTYSTGDGKRDLFVRIDARPCRDTMSGERFSSTVTVTLDGKTYRGCGKPLH